MVDDANVTHAETPAGESDEQRAAPAATEATTAGRSAESEAPPTRPSQQRAWSMAKSPITRKHIDEIGRIALVVVTAVATFIADAAQLGARAVTRVCRAVAAVPPVLQLFAGAGLLLLFGIVGAITLHDSVGVMCIVVVVPVCSGILGVLGHRWYLGQGVEAMSDKGSQSPEQATPDLQRSVHYVDKKLALALTSLGTEHHQQAVIALFQAKTAVELTLGTEQDGAGCVDVPLRADDYGLRPRIRAGTGSTLRESNSLAAS